MIIYHVKWIFQMDRLILIGSSIVRLCDRKNEIKNSEAVPRALNQSPNTSQFLMPYCCWIVIFFLIKSQIYKIINCQYFTQSNEINIWANVKIYATQVRVSQIWIQISIFVLLSVLVYYPKTIICILYIICFFIFMVIFIN